MIRQLVQLVASLAVVALGLGCHSSDTTEGGKLVAYRDQVVFELKAGAPKRGISVMNLGPGPVTTTVQARAGGQASEEIPEGEARTYVIDGVRAIAWRHPDPRSARLKWSTAPELMHLVRIKVD